MVTRYSSFKPFSTINTIFLGHIGQLLDGLDRTISKMNSFRTLPLFHLIFIIGPSI